MQLLKKTNPIGLWRIRVLCLLALLVSLWPNTLLAQQAKPARVSTLLAITGTGQIRSGFDMKVVEAMLLSTEFVNPAIEEATGLEPDAWPGIIQIELTPVGQRASQLRVTVLPGGQIDEPADAAVKVLNTLTSRVTKAFNNLSVNQTEGLEAEYEEQVAMRDELTDKINAIELKLKDMPPLSRDAGGDPMHERNERAIRIRALNQLVQTQRIKLDAIRKGINEVRDDPSLAPLDNAPLMALIDARASVVQALEAKEPVDTVRLAEAKAELAEARYELAKLQRGSLEEQLDRWEARYIDMRIELTQTESELEALKVIDAQATEPDAQQSESGQDRTELYAVLQSNKQDLRRVTQRVSELERERSQIRSNPKLIIVSEVSETGDTDNDRSETD